MNANKEFPLVLGARIKNMRQNKKITREQLAEKIDVSARFLADVESSKVGVSILTLVKLCNVLETTSDYLLGLTSFSDEEQRYINIDNKIKKIPKGYLEHLDVIIDAFCNATLINNTND